MKIGILCSHPFVFPSLQYLAEKGMLCGAAGPLKEGFSQVLKSLADRAFVPYKTINDDNGESIAKWRDLIMPDKVFVMGFPYKIPEKILSQLDFYNFHTGLLPDYRGIDPVFWQIRNEETHGGISVHLMDRGFDTGPVAHIQKLDILSHETYGLHLQRLALTAREASEIMTEKLTAGNIKLKAQEKQDISPMPRPDFKDLLIDWDSQTSKSIKAQVQAANPAYGGAVSFYKNTFLRITQVSIQNDEQPAQSQPGTVISTENKLSIICIDGNILNLEIIFCDAGLFTGDRLAKVLNIKKGDIFASKPVY